MRARIWRAVILAAGRGPSDPMAMAHGVSHKCAIPVGGQPMLARVVDTLLACPRIDSIAVCIEDPLVGRAILGPLGRHVTCIASKGTAAQSAASAIAGYPTLVTTADHPLLDEAMLDHFFDQVEFSSADVAVALARAETILGAFPEAKRTFLAFGRDRVSGCNLFAIRTENALKALEFWRYLEPLRKKPWRLVSAFGLLPLARYMTGSIDLETAFAIASSKLKLKAIPVLMPFPEAAVDVDKPADKALAEAILAARAKFTSLQPSSSPEAGRPENPPRTR